MKEQEEMKSKLFNLQEILLKELASAQGDILQNKDLLNSLNETKASSEDISKALAESKNLEAELDRECETFKPIAEFASRLYFTVSSLSKISVMNQYSVQSFKKLFQKSLKSSENLEGTFESQKRNLLKIVYNYVSRSLFKADRLIFALHLAQETFPEAIKPQEWKVFTGEAITEVKAGSVGRNSLPEWVEEDRVFDIHVLKTALPQFFQNLALSEDDEWRKFAKSGHCEKDIPKDLSRKLSKFEQLLMIQAFRPDRLLSSMTSFCLNILRKRQELIDLDVITIKVRHSFRNVISMLIILDLETLSPPSIRLSQIFEESTNTEPILLIMSPGADPSEELRILSKTTLGTDLHEVRWTRMIERAVNKTRLLL